jgi:PAS domain S-box-containing protein
MEVDRGNGLKSWDLNMTVGRGADSPSSQGRPVSSAAEAEPTNDILSQSEERFRALVTASSDAVYRMSPDWSEMRNLDGRDFIADTHEPSRSWLEKYIHPADQPLVLATIATAIRNKSVFELEHRVLRVDGTLGWTSSRAIPMLDTHGEIVEWIGTASDITDSKCSEETLAQQRRLYEAILTNTPDLAYVFDLDHRFIYANEGLLRMWGKSWDEAIGKNCLELGYPPWHAELHDRDIEQVIATKRPVRGEVPFTGTFGLRDYDYLFVPVLGANGEVEAVAGTTRDVTERKQLEASLKEADRRKDEFLATLAHELRNPLAPIRNAAHLLKLAEPSDLQVRAARDIILRQVQHMVRLVDDLMEVSRITLGQVHLRNDRASLRAVLTDALESAGTAIEAGGHGLTVELPAQVLELEGDPTRLSQVFQNLLNNAAKYTPRGGQITVRAERCGAEVRVSVRDTGIGIPKEAQPRVFEMFTRVHPSDRIKTSGLGIGLALAKQLVELHNGRIEVCSEGSGAGSEFIVYLPVLEMASPTPGHAETEPSVRTSHRKRRVLVVDDNRDAASSLAMLLEIAGCVVSVAFDGPQALDSFESFAPEVVLLDIGMPGMDGYEVAQSLREKKRGKEVLLVALTGWGQSKDKRRAVQAGFDEHLTKPVDPNVLATLLNVENPTTH